MFHITRGLADLIFILLNIYSVLLINGKTLLHVYRMHYDYSHETDIRLIALGVYEYPQISHVTRGMSYMRCSIEPLRLKIIK